MPGLPAWVGADLGWVVDDVWAPGVEVCSVLRALVGGEGSIEVVRSGIGWGLAEAARGGLCGLCWLEMIEALGG